MAKLIAILLLLAVVAALMTSLVFLVRDPSNRRRTLTGLKVRIALSLSLIVFLLLAWQQGWIQPHSALPPATRTPAP